MSFTSTTHLVEVPKGNVHFTLSKDHMPVVTVPLIDAVSTIDNGPHGGNLDVPEFGPGTTVYLPINVDGALMFLGDCHAVQGDGELCGCGAIEIRTYTT